MIRHIVFFSARDEAVREEVGRGLELLKANPHARHLEVGRNLNTDTLSERVDFVVYGEFDDEAALAAYKAHPIYQASSAAVRPLREMRIAADFKAALPES